VDSFFCAYAEDENVINATRDIAEVKKPFNIAGSF
jgi:hypothetical protein